MPAAIDSWLMAMAFILTNKLAIEITNEAPRCRALEERGRQSQSLLRSAILEGTCYLADFYFEIWNEQVSIIVFLLIIKAIKFHSKMSII